MFQAVTSIVSGQYPTTLPEATLLAGTQCQAVYGNHDPKKHVPGFIKLADMIPAQWLTHKKFKPKQIENMVFQEWKKIPHTSDVNAKYKYVSSVRKLPTYGITFYTVKVRFLSHFSIFTIFVCDDQFLTFSLLDAKSKR